MDDIVRSSTVALFAAAGATLHVRDGHDLQPTNATIAGVIGFMSDKMRGTLMIASTFNVFAMTRPLELRHEVLSEHVEADRLKVCDWAAELANQLMGRIKNRLFDLGVTFRMATPTALSGSALEIATPLSADALPIVFTHAAGEIWVRWDAVTESDVALVRPTGDTAAREGDVLMF